MSQALFHDTVTLYLPVEEGMPKERRVIRNVKTVVTDTQDERRAVIYLPLWGRRSLRYLPKAWDGRKDRFTVRAGDHLVCYDEASALPPDGALTVRTVIRRESGSCRLWHLEIHADNRKVYIDNQTNEEETEDEGTEA